MMILLTRPCSLASRQRKKKHTEELECKEKNFSGQISELEQSVINLTAERERLAHERQILLHRQQESDRLIEAMGMEKRDMIMKHTEETSSLRKKVQVLMDQLDAGPVAMSANPSSTGFTDFNAEMEALSMGAHDWDFTFANDLHNNGSGEFTFDPQIPLEPNKRSQVVEKKASTNTIVPSKNADHSHEPPVASGLLFMLLLCGAFVASRPTMSSSSELPITSDVRAAAPAVLNNLLSEAGAGAGANYQHVQSITRSYHDPMPPAATQLHRRPDGRMDQLQHRILSPSKQQEFDDAFSLTPAQYAAMTSDDISSYDHNLHNGPSQASQQGHRTLAESLSHMQPPDSGSKAEVYTRSLLFDQIPPDVVKQFREMVRERERLDSRDQFHQDQDHHFYKREV
jgi:hypothetical protein